MMQDKNLPIVFSLLDTPAFGGAETYLVQALCFLVDEGYPVVLATNNDHVREEIERFVLERTGDRPVPTIESLRPGHFALIHLPYRLDAIGNWKGLLKYFVGLPFAIAWLIKTVRDLQLENFKLQTSNSKTLNPILCFFPGYTDRLSFSPIVKLLGCRLIWLEYGPLEATFKRTFGFPKLLYAIGRSYPDHVITVSQHTKHSLMHTGNIPSEKISIVYPGVEVHTLSQIKELRQKGQRLFEKLVQEGSGFKVLGKIITTVARLASEKEIDVLIKAFAQLVIDASNNATGLEQIGKPAPARKIDSANRLLIIGDGPVRQDLEQLAEDLGVADRIIFTGFVSEEEKKALVSISTLFVFPSAWELEGFGMTTIEAMSLGVPVITTRAGPQGEIVTNRKTGWTFAAHDVEDLAQHVQLALKSNRLEVIGANGKKTAERIFSVQNMRSKLVHCIEATGSLLSQG